MTFRYRFVRFGTSFSAAEGSRGADAGDAEPEKLYENEVAVDVGGRCIGCDASLLNVIDHHFFSHEGTLPSAACAVVHHGPELLARFAQRNDETIWLVAHRDADFDAFSAMFLVRWLLTERPSPEHWDEAGIRSGAVDWYEARRIFERRDPDEAVVTALRWAVLLASYAAYVDNAQRIFVPRERALHSVFYAALLRARPFPARDNGARELFAQARVWIESGRDPLFDIVLDRNGTFAPEFDLLEREAGAYERDLRHARQSVVYLPVARTPFDDWYEHVKTQPLTDSEGNISAGYLDPVDNGRRRAMDAIYLRDPECLLFKEWARADVDASSMHRGFTFTFVVYSRERAEAELNTGNYYVALDPNDAGDCHLYTVWAKLQTAEIRTLLQRETVVDAARPARSGFEGRAGDFAPFFDDPWFDTPNYGCTLVATPSRGTVIGAPGHASDCRDDPVFELVREELETWVYDPPVLQYHDASAVSVGPPSLDGTGDVRDHKPIPPAERTHFRFAKVQLRESAELASSAFALQVADMLWRALHPKSRGIATEVLSSHLFRFGGVLGVWSRAGVALAYTPDAAESVETLGDLFKEVARCACLTDELIKAEKPAANSAVDDGVTKQYSIAQRVELGENVLRSLAETWHKLVLPEGRVLSNFVDEIGLATVAQALRDLTTATRTEEQNTQLDQHMAIVADVQTKVEWLELLFVGIYATEIGHVISEYATTAMWRLLTTLLLAAFLTAPAVMFLQPWKHREKANELRSAKKPDGATLRAEPSRDAFGVVLLCAFGLVIVLGLIVGILIATGNIPNDWTFINAHPKNTTQE